MLLLLLWYAMSVFVRKPLCFDVDDAHVVFAAGRIGRIDQALHDTLRLPRELVDNRVDRCGIDEIGQAIWRGGKLPEPIDRSAA